MLDLHVDCIIQQRLFRYNMRQAHRPGRPGQPLFWHSDVPRMHQASYVGACLGVHFWPIETPERGWRELHKQIDYLDSVAEADSTCLRVRTPQDWQRARDQHLLALAPGVEGAHMLGGRLDRVADLARRGVAYLTLTHFSKNSAATPSMGRGANEAEGLTAFGKDLIRALEDHDILVDLAHVNTPGVLDACAVATKPLLCTHTGVKGAFDHARNVTDAELDAIAATGGIIGIMFAPCFMADSLKADSTCVLDHIEYAVHRVGIDHVALGSDFDGWLPTIPSDMRDCTDLPKITNGLRARGWSQQDLDKLTHENALRVLSRG